MHVLHSQLRQHPAPLVAASMQEQELRLPHLQHALLQHEVLPPELREVALDGAAGRAKVVEAGHAAVDLERRDVKQSPLQRVDLQPGCSAFDIKIKTTLQQKLVKQPNGAMHAGEKDSGANGIEDRPGRSHHGSPELVLVAVCTARCAFRGRLILL